MDYHEFERLMARRSTISRKYRVEIFLVTTFLAGMAMRKVGKIGMAEKRGLKDVTLELTATQQLAILMGKRVKYDAPFGPIVIGQYHG